MEIKFEEKKKLREQVRKKLAELETHTFEKYSLDLSTNLFKFFQTINVIQEKKIIGAFAPIEYEPIWYKSFNTITRDNELKFSFPSIGSTKSEMVFRMANLEDLVMKSDFGSKILGPNELCEKVVPDLLLIPALAFSKKGERLGRGKGYFDRYLENFSGLKIGICFELQLFDRIPVEEHDILCDMLITEKNIYKY